MKVTKASIILEIDGNNCAAMVEGIDLNLLTEVIASISPTGTLRLVTLPDTFKWESLGGNNGH